MTCIIVLPCFNEARNLASLLSRLHHVLSSTIEYMVIAVNDGSTDDTMHCLENLRRQYPLKILNHETNRGLSETLITGFRYAIQIGKEEDVIVTMDADDTHDPHVLPAMLTTLERNGNSGIVVASRFVKGGIQLNVPTHRIILSLLVNTLMRMLTGINAKDLTSGYRCYSYKTIKHLFSHYETPIEAKGFEASFELLVKIWLLESSVYEVPIVLDYGRKKGRSKMKLVPTIFRYLRLAYKSRQWTHSFDAARYNYYE